MTQMRPVFARRWEVTREKPGNFSTSAKKSRTNDRTMLDHFISRKQSCPSPVEARELYLAAPLDPEPDPSPVRSRANVLPRKRICARDLLPSEFTLIRALSA